MQIAWNGNLVGRFHVAVFGHIHLNLAIALTSTEIVQFFRKHNERWTRAVLLEGLGIFLLHDNHVHGRIVLGRIVRWQRESGTKIEDTISNTVACQADDRRLNPWFRLKKRESKRVEKINKAILNYIINVSKSLCSSSSNWRTTIKKIMFFLNICTTLSYGDASDSVCHVASGDASRLWACYVFLIRFAVRWNVCFRCLTVTDALVQWHLILPFVIFRFDKVRYEDISQALSKNVMPN